APRFPARVSPMADGRAGPRAEHLADHREGEPGRDGRGFLHAGPRRTPPHAGHLPRRLQDETARGSRTARGAATDRVEGLPTHESAGDDHAGRMARTLRSL